MSNQYNFTGADLDFFMRSGLDVYSNANGVRQYIGKTGNEKTYNANFAFAEWWDNVTGTQSLYAIGISKFDPTMSFTMMQLADPNAFALAHNMEKDDSDPNNTWLYGGSQQGNLLACEWRFVGKSVGGLQMMMVWRQGILVPNGEVKFGTPNEYNTLPVTLRAKSDTTVSNANRNLIYFVLQDKSYS
jgi:hypothetical protein